MITFDSFDLTAPLLKAIQEAGYTSPTPIQERAIPMLLDGKDVLGCAQTGTGKTAAFALPILEILYTEEPLSPGNPIRALILAPTRELAAQIEENIQIYAKHLDLKHTVIFGGVSQNSQVKALKRGIDILVATPGRLLDLIGQGHVDLSGIEFFVLDEADRMLDMGFIHDIRRVIKLLPKDRQNLLFSATMPNSIADLAKNVLVDPVRIDIEPEKPAVDRIEQSVMFIEKSNKRRLLSKLIHELDTDRIIVFSRTKHGANRIVKHLTRDNIKASAIHGNKSQNARRRALDGLRTGEIDVLVATDIAARGIDVENITHVFNFDLPNEPETYVHRIGRTARAGREGIAISFCDDSESDYLRDIQKLIGFKIDVDIEHDWHFPEAIPSVAQAKRAADNRKQRKQKANEQRKSQNKSHSNSRRRRRQNPGGGGQNQSNNRKNQSKSRSSKPKRNNSSSQKNR